MEETQQAEHSQEFDPLEEAIARVQELEEQLKTQIEEAANKEQDIYFALVLKLKIFVVDLNKT